MAYKQTIYELNEEQKRAVEAPFKPIFIIAGAGTGKTQTLTQRVNHYLESGIDPNRILAITFTRKSTQELRDRISNIGNSAEIKNIYTFHAFFKHILETETDEFKNLKIISEDARKWLIRKITKDLKIKVNVDDLVKELTREKIEELKKCLKDEKTFNRKLTIIAENSCFPVKEAWEQILLNYFDFLKNNGFFEFCDLTSKINELLDTDKDFRMKLSSKFDAILIDEFQDTSELHFEIVKKITKKDSNIFFVGDPDQSIYGFRDAIKNSDKQFENYYQNGEIITLEQNYRSTEPILETANKLISHNYKDPKEVKKLWTTKSGGERVFYKKFSNHREEIQWIIDEVFDLHQRRNIPLRDIAILCRNNHMINDVEDEIKKKYRYFKIDRDNKGDVLRERWIRFVLAILFVLLRDEVSIFLISDILEFIKRFNNDYSEIKNKDIEKFYDICREKKAGFTNAIENIDSFKMSKGAIEDFRKLGKTIISLRDKKNLQINSWMSEILEALNCIEPKEEKDGYMTEKIELFLMKMNKKYRKAEKEEILMNILSYEERGNVDYEKREGLKISTIHSAKGLEYKYVFLMRVNDGILPSDKKDSDEEEERRLTYVAFTRAKTKLMITFAPLEKHPFESIFIDESKDPQYFYEC